MRPRKEKAATRDSLDELALEDVPERDPGQEPLQSLEGAVQQGRLLAAVQDVLAQLVDFREFLEGGETDIELTEKQSNKKQKNETKRNKPYQNKMGSHQFSPDQVAPEN